MEKQLFHVLPKRQNGESQLLVIDIIVNVENSSIFIIR